MDLPTAALTPFLLLRKASSWHCTKGTAALPWQIKTKTNAFTTCYTCAVSALMGFWSSFIPIAWQIRFTIYSLGRKRDSMSDNRYAGARCQVWSSGLEAFSVDGRGGRFSSSLLTCSWQGLLDHPRMPTPHGRVQTDSSELLTHHYMDVPLSETMCFFFQNGGSSRTNPLIGI